MLLSTAQILRGKLERGHAKLPHDVYDVVKAGEFDPRSLPLLASTGPDRTADGPAGTEHTKAAWDW